MAERTEHLSVFHHVCLAQHVTTLGMTDLNNPHPHFLQHKGRNLAGELPLVLPAHILRPQANVAFLGDDGSGGQGGEGRNDEKLHALAADAGSQFTQPRQEICRHGDGFIHFGVCADIEFVCRDHEELSPIACWRRPRL